MHHVVPGMCKFYFRPCTTAVSHSGEPSRDTGVSLYCKQRGIKWPVAINWWNQTT